MYRVPWTQNDYITPICSSQDIYYFRVFFSVVVGFERLSVFYVLVDNKSNTSKCFLYVSWTSIAGAMKN